METPKIDENEFWRIIEEGSAGPQKPGEICDEITKILSNYLPDEIINFECIFGRNF